MRQMEEKNINKLQINECATFELRRRRGHAHSAGFRTPAWKRRSFLHLPFIECKLLFFLLGLTPELDPLEAAGSVCAAFTEARTSEI